MPLTMPYLNADIERILENPEAGYRQWSMHGIGMLRTYLDPDRRLRLNLWHRELLNPGISTMHDHPWPFTSRIIAGRLTNQRFARCTKNSVGAILTMEGKITCGAGYNGMKPDPQIVTLHPCEPEVYTAGMEYLQRPEEIHDTRAEDGTITVIERGAERPDCEASVFWPVGQPWGDASRPFDPDLARHVIRCALTRLRHEEDDGA